ncbi:MAG: DUF2322 family protein [Rhizobacter sp.]|nr:DUF2322 family protein [Rhizobacter sp.]
MAFADNLKALPAIHHLAGLQLLDAEGAVAAQLDNKPGSAGSVAVYAALAQRYGAITVEAAHEGLALYAEHTADARAHPGKHPNIDRLLALVERGGRFDVKLVPA